MVTTLLLDSSYQKNIFLYIFIYIYIFFFFFGVCPMCFGALCFCFRTIYAFGALFVLGFCASKHYLYACFSLYFYLFK